MTSIPATMRAFMTLGGGQTGVREVATPRLGPGEVLVKVAAIAQNPTDYRHADMAAAGTILGVDFAGTVVQVAENVRGLAVGARVAGFEHGGLYGDRGTMAEYLKAQADLVWRVPDGTSIEEAATMCTGVWTSIQAMYGPGRLGLAEHVDGPDAPWFLVYSGATSTGQYAVQLAHLAGYRVVTTASPRNFDLLKRLGADVVIDYNAADVSEQIRAATGDTLSVGLDAISVPESERAAVKAFGSAGGKLIVILSPDEEAEALRADVKLQFTLIYTSLGNAFEFFYRGHWPANPADRAHMVSWIPKITELVGAGKLLPNKVKIWPGGLDGIKDGLAYMKAGKVQAEKIVYSL